MTNLLSLLDEIEGRANALTSPLSMPDEYTALAEETLPTLCRLLREALKVVEAGQAMFDAADSTLCESNGLTDEHCKVEAPNFSLSVFSESPMAAAISDLDKSYGPMMDALAAFRTACAEMEE